MNCECGLRKRYLWWNGIPYLKPSNFSQPTSTCFKVSPVRVTWLWFATHSHPTSSQSESRETGADWKDKFWVMEGQKRCKSERRKMWTQSAMCWLYWLGAWAKKSPSIPSFPLFTLTLTTRFPHRLPSHLTFDCIICITGRTGPALCAVQTN